MFSSVADILNHYSKGEKEMKIKMDCFECDGKGWVAVRGIHNLPEQETCPTCEGEKQMLYEEEEISLLFGDGTDAK